MLWQKSPPYSSNFAEDNRAKVFLWKLVSNEWENESLSFCQDNWGGTKNLSLFFQIYICIFLQDKIFIGYLNQSF